MIRRWLILLILRLKTKEGRIKRVNEKWLNRKEREVSIMGEHNCYKKDAAECIKKKTYELWEKDRCNQGRDLDYWLNAEKVVKSQIKNNIIKSPSRN